MVWAIHSDEKLRVNNRLISQVGCLCERRVLSIRGKRLLGRKRYDVNLLYHVRRPVRQQYDGSFDPAAVFPHYSGSVTLECAEFLDRFFPHGENGDDCYLRRHVEIAS